MTDRRGRTPEVLSSPHDGPEPAPAEMPVAVPRLYELSADYVIECELGRGGAAVVYRARERALGRDVAIKVLHHSQASDADAVARLRREAHVVARLRHPNIVPLFGTRQLADGSIALIMEYVPGRTLRAALRADGPQPVPLVESVLCDIAQALHYAHARHGIVHRDIKPDNIYIDADVGRALLADFGIARPGEADATLTIAGAALGTPAYMSPEQIDGVSLDGRSDLYSLGLVAWEMLTGQQPWAGHNLFGIIYRQKHEDLPPVQDVRTDVPQRLLDVIAGLLHKDPDQRFPDAMHVVRRLRSGESTAPAPQRTVAGRSPAPAAVPDVDTPTVMYRRADVDTRIELAAHATEAAAAAQAALDDAARAKRVLRARRSRALLAVGTLLALASAGMFAVWERPARAAAPAADAPAAPALRPAAPGVPGGASRVVAIGAAELTVPVASVVPLGVRVEDSDGRLVAGAVIDFTVVAGGGSVRPGNAVTDSTGVAMAMLTVGTTAGANEVHAAVRGREDVAAVLRAHGIAGPAVQLARVSGDRQAVTPGTVLAQPLVVIATDEHGNPVAGAPVEFVPAAGAGTVIPAQAVTDERGHAEARWTPGTGASTLRVVAMLPQTDVRVTFDAASGARLATRPWITAGGAHSCVLAASGDMQCWGSGEVGQLGAGAATGGAEPAEVRGVTAFTALAAGLGHTCALAEDGRAFCWGAGGSGQLGDAAGEDRSAPVPVAGGLRFGSIAAGWRHTCALARNTAHCWGDNREGQLGDGTSTDRGAPVVVAGGLRFSALAAGAAHSCGLGTDASVWCWGQNTAGQLGDGSRDASPRPVRVSTDVAFTAITAGAVHTCALARSGDAYCWGRNAYGQLGTGNTSDAAAPQPVTGGLRFVSLSASGSHTCGRTDAGETWCWGYNVDGQLGDGTRTDRVRPVRMRGG